MSSKKEVYCKIKPEMIRVTIIVNLLIFVTCYLIQCDGEKDDSGIVVRLERVLCICGNYCTVKTCKIVFKSRSVAEMSAIVMLTKKVSSLKFTVTSYYKFSNNEYRPLFINTEIDYCYAQAGLSESKVFDAVKSAFANNSNLYQKCPIMPGQYYLKDFNLQAKHLPSVLPVGRYLVNSTGWGQNNDWLYNASVYFSVTYHGVKDFSMG